MKYFKHESAYVDSNAVIGDNTKIWHFSHIQSKSVIGISCNLGQNVYVGSNVKIGDFVKIQNNVSVYSGVELNDYVFCGPSVVFTNDYNPRSKYPKGSDNYLKTIVKEGASIGANATIICGNTIGKWSFIGAGSVVNKDVPNYALVVGNPIKQIGWICECGEKLNNEFVCSKCGKKYYQKGENLYEEEAK